MDWTEEVIDRLRVLWAEGLSTAEIGRRLSISKNAVVGKAHRLELPARPSPIRRDESAAPRSAPPKRVSGPTLPSLALPQAVAAAAAPAAQPAVVVKPVAPPIRLVRSAPIPARPAHSAANRPAPRNAACCWPIGEPGTPTFRFCGDVALSNKPYCGPHAEIAYVRIRDRREDVA